ncbi:metabotropic glutamate receptor 5-like [Amphiura filiformis]|uniref:metabotropic glutamate receptor 5-like n=1 Tax=Amphiura filiformis TaxID=82378 RepID=UPI003B20CDD5
MSNKPSQKEMDKVIDKQLKVPKSKVIVIFASGDIGTLMVKQMKSQNLHLNITFIGSDGWGYDTDISLFADIVGSIFIRPQFFSDPKFVHFVNNFDPKVHAQTPWAIEYWANCENDPLCPHSVLYRSSYASVIILCVDVIVHALDSLFNELNQHDQHNDMKTLSQNITGEMLLKHLLNVDFNTSIGSFRFDEVGDSLGSYSIFNVQDTGKFVQVGSWDAKQANNALQIQNMQFAGNSTLPPYSLCREFCEAGYIIVPLESNCCYGCQKCQDNAIVVNATQCQLCSQTTWPDEEFKKCNAVKPTFITLKDPIIITIMTFGVLGLAVCIIASIAMFKYRNHPLIKATSKELSAINLCGLFLAFLNIFLVLCKPSLATCSLTETLISLSFTTMFTPTLLKVVRIYRIFQAGNKTAKRPRFVGVRDQMVFGTLLISIQVLIVVISTIINPATPSYLFASPPANYIQLYCSFSIGFLISCV